MPIPSLSNQHCADTIGTQAGNHGDGNHSSDVRIEEKAEYPLLNRRDVTPACLDSERAMLTLVCPNVGQGKIFLQNTL